MADQGTVARLIEVAKAEIGTIEGPKDNETKYGKFTKADFQPWCGSFVNWCGNEAGVKIPKTVYTPAGAAAFKKANRWYDAQICDPEPGDIAYFDFPADGVDRISHVGIVIKDNGDGTVWCIEGNTSSDDRGSQRNGGQVARKLRAYKKNKRTSYISIVGFGRPKFKGAGASAPAAARPAVEEESPEVKAAIQLLTSKGYKVAK